MLADASKEDSKYNSACQRIMPAAKQTMLRLRGLSRRILLMQRLVGFSIFLILFANPAFAQDVAAGSQAPDATKSSAASAPQDETPPVAKSVSKTEISGGFTLHRFYDYAGSGQTIVMPGGYADIEHNIIQRWLGAELQISAAYKDQGAPGKLGIYTVMAGPTFYPLGHRKITVFGHILAGEGFYRDTIAASAGFPSQVKTYTSLAWTAGAGLDLSVSKSLSVRLAQFDYVQTKFLGGTVHDHDARISVGIVYHFGVK
jgi:hypothetical protein